MGNWNIETLDGTKILLENVCFMQQIAMPNSNFSQSVPLDNNSILITAEGGNTNAINCNELREVTRMDDGFMFTCDNQKVCGSPSLQGRIVLSGFLNSNSVIIILDNIQKVTMCEEQKITEDTENAEKNNSKS